MAASIFPFPGASSSSSKVPTEPLRSERSDGARDEFEAALAREADATDRSEVRPDRSRNETEPTDTRSSDEPDKEVADDASEDTKDAFFTPDTGIAANAAIETNAALVLPSQSGASAPLPTGAPAANLLTPTGPLDALSTPVGAKGDVTAAATPAAPAKAEGAQNVIPIGTGRPASANALVASQPVSSDVPPNGPDEIAVKSASTAAVSVDRQTLLERSTPQLTLVSGAKPDGLPNTQAQQNGSLTGSVPTLDQSATGQGGGAGVGDPNGKATLSANASSSATNPSGAQAVASGQGSVPTQLSPLPALQSQAAHTLDVFSTTDGMNGLSAPTSFSTGLASDPVMARSMSQPGAPAVQQVIEHVIRTFDGRSTKFDIRLDPPELGKVDVKIEVGPDSKVNAVFAARDPAALEALMRGAKTLENALTQAGIDLSENGLKFEMRQDGRNGFDRQSKSSHDGHPNGAPSEPTPDETPERSLRPVASSRLDITA